MSKVRWLGLSAGIVMILAAFGLVLWQEQTISNNGGVALAQGASTSTPTAAATPTGGATSTPSPSQQNKNDIGEAFWKAFAAKLGLNEADVKAKALEVRKEMIDQAVKDGRVSQDEANRIKERMDANGLIAPIFLGRGARPPAGATPRAVGPRLPGRFGFGFGLDALEAVAKAVKLTPAELTTQLRDKSLADIAKAQGVDEATVKQAIIDVGKAQVDRELQAGLITQAQADQLKARLTPENIDLSRRPFFFPFRLR